MRKLSLPGPVVAYFEADRRDGATVAHCFTEDGVVKDEGTSHTGRTAIEAWKAAASSQYAYTVEPISLDREKENYIVTARVTGNFTGSPLDLRYAFTLEHDKIASLEITPCASI